MRKNTSKALALGFFLGAVTTGLIIGAAAPAHAEPNTYFLECMAQRGYAVVDPADAVRWGSFIQKEELAGISVSAIEIGLEAAGFDPYKAENFVNCAALTWVTGT